MVRQNKKAAIELSIGTIVIIVLAMSMLILGIVLVRKIFVGAITSTDTLNDKVKSEISQLFTDEGRKVTVRLGADKTVKIKSDNTPFGIGIGATTPDGKDVGGLGGLKYVVSLQAPSEAPGNCIALNSPSEVNSWFSQRPDVPQSFDEFEGANAYAIIRIQIPQGKATCSQKIFIQAKDERASSSTFGQTFGASSFILEVQPKGLIG